MKLTLGGATILVALVAAFVVPAVFANAGDPDSTSATWRYQDPSNPNGPVVVTVSGTWSWGTNPSGGKDSQSCWKGGKPETSVAGYNDVNGHWAVGIAVSWNDSSTPNTLTGKNTSGQPVTLHLGNSMDWINPNYCAGTTASNPYPSGTFSAQHVYPSLAAFNAAVPNGGMCVNAYDVHKPNDAKESNPAQNGDNTLHNGHYSLSVDCATAANGNPPSTPAPAPAPTPAPAPAPAPTPAQPSTPAPPDLNIVKLERVGVSGNFVPGPVTGRVGDTVFYEILVTNPQTDTYTLNVTLSDPRCDANTLAPSVVVSLGPGQEQTYTCSHVLVAGDQPEFRNTATATAQPLNASASVRGVTRSASVVADVGPAVGVKGAHKVIVRKVAKPAPRRAVVKAASFTG